MQQNDADQEKGNSKPASTSLHSYEQYVYCAVQCCSGHIQRRRMTLQHPEGRGRASEEREGCHTLCFESAEARSVRLVDCTFPESQAHMPVQQSRLSSGRQNVQSPHLHADGQITRPVISVPRLGQAARSAVDKKCPQHEERQQQSRTEVSQTLPARPRAARLARGGGVE